MPRKAQPKSMVSDEHGDQEGAASEVCAAQMARTTVKLLQIRTAVLVAPMVALMEVLAAAKSAEVPATVDQVGAEQAAEEHDFGGEEDPHAEAGRVALLLFGGEVVQECGIVGGERLRLGRALLGRALLGLALLGHPWSGYRAMGTSWV